MKIERIIQIAQWAWEIILPFYKSINLDIKTKRDENDPVTAADFASDSYIKEQLKTSFPDDYILTEETSNDTIDRSWSVWIVDPLDGTKNFINQQDSFCVMIGHCTNGIPDLGVVFFPVTWLTYYAEHWWWSYRINKNGEKTLLQANNNRSTLGEAILHCSKWTERFILDNQIITDTHTWKKITALQSARCLWYSDCKICDWELDAIITFHNRTGKRDTCAPQIILEESGAKITHLDWSPLQYNQQWSYREHGHIAWTNSIHNEIINYLTL